MPPQSPLALVLRLALTEPSCFFNDLGMYSVLGPDGSGFGCHDSALAPRDQGIVWERQAKGVGGQHGWHTTQTNGVVVVMVMVL